MMEATKIMQFSLCHCGIENLLIISYFYTLKDLYFQKLPINVKIVQIKGMFMLKSLRPIINLLVNVKMPTIVGISTKKQDKFHAESS